MPDCPVLALVPRIRAVVHDLNNSLVPILMSVQLLRRKTADPDLQRWLDVMAGHAWKGTEIARSLLMLAEKGTLEPAKIRKWRAARAGKKIRRRRTNRQLSP